MRLFVERSPVARLVEGPKVRRAPTTSGQRIYEEPPNSTLCLGLELPHKVGQAG